MELTERNFEDYSSIRVTFSTGKLNCLKCKRELLVIHFSSKTDVNHDDLCLMNAMKLAASNIWFPEAIILDFRNLWYKWGDTMEFLFQSPYMACDTPLQKIFASQGGERILIKAVCSDKNREGLTSLIRDEMEEDLTQVLFESLDEAVNALEAELNK